MRALLLIAAIAAAPAPAPKLRGMQVKPGNYTMIWYGDPHRFQIYADGTWDYWINDQGLLCHGDWSWDPWKRILTLNDTHYDGKPRDYPIKTTHHLDARLCETWPRWSWSPKPAQLIPLKE